MSKITFQMSYYTNYNCLHDVNNCVNNCLHIQKS